MTDDTNYTITELIAELERIRDTHGDLVVKPTSDGWLGPEVAIGVHTDRNVVVLKSAHSASFTMQGDSYDRLD